ncbi:MAG: hypothetical protein C4560_10980 [Nitrospiraceae bacterium]|nr:MAG: hypothetical protein C4560_10980 [Nitrospiraceae bacterium]
MKGIIYILLLLVFAFSDAGAGVIGTPHDVNVMRHGNKRLETCAMCHTPHSRPLESPPLWNRNQPSQGYTMYESPSYDMDEAKTLQPPSTYCMTCHNGVSSTLVNYPGRGSNFTDPAYNINNGDPLFSDFTRLGLDLKNNHPVSFTYEPADDVDNNGFPAPQPLGSGERKAIIGSQGKYPLYGTNGDQFECATCHDVHDTVDYPGKEITNGESSGTQVFFLRADNSGSKMCTDCHTNR